MKTINSLIQKYVEVYCNSNKVYQVGDLLRSVVTGVCTAREKELKVRLLKPLRKVKKYNSLVKINALVDEAIEILEKVDYDNLD